MRMEAFAVMTVPPVTRLRDAYATPTGQLTTLHIRGSPCGSCAFFAPAPDASFFPPPKVLQWQAGIDILWQQEGHGDASGIPCPTHGLLEEGLSGVLGLTYVLAHRIRTSKMGKTTLRFLPSFLVLRRSDVLCETAGWKK